MSDNRVWVVAHEQFEMFRILVAPTSFFYCLHDSVQVELNDGEDEMGVPRWRTPGAERKVLHLLAVPALEVLGLALRAHAARLQLEAAEGGDVKTDCICSPDPNRAYGPCHGRRCPRQVPLSWCDLCGREFAEVGHAPSCIAGTVEQLKAEIEQRDATIAALRAPSLADLTRALANHPDNPSVHELLLHLEVVCGKGHTKQLVGGPVSCFVEGSTTPGVAIAAPGRDCSTCGEPASLRLRVQLARTEWTTQPQEKEKPDVAKLIEDNVRALADARRACVEAENWLSCHGVEGAGSETDEGLVGLLKLLRAIPGVPNSDSDVADVAAVVDEGISIALAAHRREGEGLNAVRERVQREKAAAEVRDRFRSLETKLEDEISALNDAVEKIEALEQTARETANALGLLAGHSEADIAGIVTSIGIRHAKRS